MTSLVSRLRAVRPRGMQPRFSPVYVVLLALALAPAAASAQAPASEPILAQARAFGDAALALETERNRLEPSVERAVARRAGVAPCFEEAEGKFETAGYFILLADVLPPAARVIYPAVDRFVGRLEAAGPGEPILASGAAGWRERATVYQRLAA